MSVKRFVSTGASREWSAGPWVRIVDYESLQAALREALDEWEKADVGYGTETQWSRIASLRKQFLDDKEPS